MTKITHDQINQMTLAQLNAIVSDKTIASTAAATTSAAGLVELATDVETQAGTDAARVVTAAGLKSAVPFQTTAAMNLYVNPGAAYGAYGAGSDSNAGTQAAPFATIAAAIAKVPKVLGHNVLIYLVGEPHYYEWKPDGTNGIRFTTGDSGVTIAVEAGTTLGVALSGSAVTITLATGGSTIAQIIAAIYASATVGPVIHPIAVGTASTNITATLAAQTLAGGNVRTYSESPVISGFVGSGTLTISAVGGVTNHRGVIIATTSGIVVNSAVKVVLIATVYSNSATVTGVGVDVLQNVVNVSGTIKGKYIANIRYTGALGYLYMLSCYGADYGVYSRNTGSVALDLVSGYVVAAALVASGGIIFKESGVTITAPTVEIKTLGGQIF